MFDLSRNDVRLRSPLAVLLPALLGAVVPTDVKADINAKVAQLEIGKSTLTDVIRIFGEPTDYSWGKRSFVKDKLPETYIMAYPKRFQVVISGGRVDEVRIFNRTLSDSEMAWLAGHTSPISIPADLYQDDVIDFKDLAVLGDAWLDKVFWP